MFIKKSVMLLSVFIQANSSPPFSAGHLLDIKLVTKGGTKSDSNREDTTILFFVPKSTRTAGMDQQNNWYVQSVAAFLAL